MTGFFYADCGCYHDEECSCGSCHRLRWHYRKRARGEYLLRLQRLRRREGKPLPLLLGQVERGLTP